MPPDEPFDDHPGVFLAHDDSAGSHPSDEATQQGQIDDCLREIRKEYDRGVARVPLPVLLKHE